MLLSFYQVAAHSFSQPRLHSSMLDFHTRHFPLLGGWNAMLHRRCSLISILIYRERASYAPMGHGCSKLQIWVCKHTAEFRQWCNTTLQTMSSWRRLNAEFPKGTFCSSTKTHPDAEGKVQLPFHLLLFQPFLSHDARVSPLALSSAHLHAPRTGSESCVL